MSLRKQSAICWHRISHEKNTRQRLKISFSGTLLLFRSKAQQQHYPFFRIYPLPISTATLAPGNPTSSSLLQNIDDDVVERATQII